MTLEQKAARAAKRTRCGRCQVVILDSPSAMATVTGYYRAPALGTVTPYSLCGECGLLLREFLNPRLLDDSVYRASAKILREAWEAGSG